MAKLRIDQDGVKHLKGCSHNCFETICGYVDSENTYDDDQEGTPDCFSCIAGAKDMLSRATASEVKKWVLR